MLTKRQKKSTISDHQKHGKDTGSAEVQIALLTKNIKQLTLHLKKHSKDNHSRRGLLLMVGKRRRFMQYLKKGNEKAYNKLVKSLDI